MVQVLALQTVKQNVQLIYKTVRGRRNHENESHGGSWKMAYADLITTLMSLFLLLWLTGLGPRGENTSVGVSHGFKEKPPEKSRYRVDWVASTQDMFYRGTSDLNLHGLALLERVLCDLSAFTNDFSITGTTDPGSDDMKLALARAEKVAVFLKSRGMPAGRIGKISGKKGGERNCVIIFDLV